MCPPSCFELATGLLAPPRCPACRAAEPNLPDLTLCRRCRATLAARDARLVALADRGPALAAVPYLPPATGLVAALKSGRVPAAAGCAAELIAEALGPVAGDAVVVPVAASPLRRLRRGLDPAAEIATALAARLGLACRARVLRRRGHRAQRGRSRAQRLASPPRFELRDEPPPLVLLVDDVITTGATLGRCAAALESGGAALAAVVAMAWAPAPGERIESGRRIP